MVVEFTASGSLGVFSPLLICDILDKNGLLFAGLDLLGAKDLAFSQNARQLCHLGPRLTAWEREDEMWRRTTTPGKKQDKT